MIILFNKRYILYRSFNLHIKAVTSHHLNFNFGGVKLKKVYTERKYAVDKLKI